MDVVHTREDLRALAVDCGVPRKTTEAIFSSMLLEK